MPEQLSRERLEEIRQGHSGTLCTVCEDTCEYWYACPARDVADLLAHIDALAVALCHLARTGMVLDRCEEGEE